MAQEPVMEDPSEQSQDAPAGGGFEQVVSSVSSNLMQVQQTLSQEGVPEELTSKLADLNDQYKAILQEIMHSMTGGKGPMKPGAPGSGMVDAQGGVGGVPV